VYKLGEAKVHPKLYAVIRWAIGISIAYAVGYMAIDFLMKTVHGVYEDGVLITSTWGRAWDLSPIVALACAGALGGYVLSKK